MKKCIPFVLLILWFSHSVAVPQQKRPLHPEDLYRFNRVSDPQISPDGKWVAYTVSQPSLETNSFNTDLWLIPVEGGTPKQLTNSPEADYAPRWSPDGKQIAFISNRDGAANIWLIDSRGGEARKLTNSQTALHAPIWSRDGKSLVCYSRVLPEGKTNLENNLKEALPLCEARTIDRLLYRQWNRWLGDKRNHVFLVSVTDGALKDVTPGDDDTPPVSLSSHHEFDISPDGREICFVKTNDPILALSTNHDLFTVSLPEGTVEQITSNKALDQQPHYSPDGRYIAYAAMQKPGYESDTRRLTLYDRQNGKQIALTQNLDRSVREIVWHPDGRRLFFTARDEGRCSIYTVDIGGKKVVRLTNEGYNTNLRVTPDKKHLVFLRSTCHQPNEIFTMPIKGGGTRQLTFSSQDFLTEIELPRLEEFWFTGAENTRVHGFLLKPPFFDENQKYPVVLTIHGGPQGMWADQFMTTWFTFPLVTSPGYVGVFINPRGSSGYGARFREEVSRDYGGRCYEDLMAGLDYVIKHYPFVDADRQAAIGGSFGGYSVNWILGHTDRFKCLVSHAGLYNLVSFYGATEELWFPAWDMGTTPWDEPDLYARWSPHNDAANFKTPTLVTHGELDYRVPVTESFQLFSALQVQGIPSRLVYFPDEGHVIGNPQNNVRWWREMHRWFETYLK